MLAPGVVIAEKYRVEQVLGRGGMGTVVEVTHAQLGTAFALKFLHRDVVGDPSILERFLREARATAALRSEHICRVFDVGTFQDLPYQVMERLEGADLAKILRLRERLPVSDACDYVLQACVGIAEAHAAQIVHRDLKPGNLFLTARPDGSPLIKVLDFGIAKAPRAAGGGGGELTRTDAILGSPSYMSPEQLQSSRLVDRRSDIWSLGVILFELVSGRRPFVGEGLADLALKIALEPAPRLPAGPPALDAVIARCLARDPAHRFQQVAELAAAIAPLASEHGRGAAAGLLRAARGAHVAAVAPAPAPPAIATAIARSMSDPAAAGDPATTMDSAGALESQAPAQGWTRLRGGAIWIMAGAIAAGVIVGVAVGGGGGGGGGSSSSGGGEPPAGPESAEPARAAASIDAAPAPAAVSPAEASAAAPAPTFPAGSEVAEPAGAAAAGSTAPATAAAPATPPKKQQPVRARPAATPKKKPGTPPPPSNDELGKSRI